LRVEMEMLAVFEAAAGEEDGEIFRGVAVGVAEVGAEEYRGAVHYTLPPCSELANFAGARLCDKALRHLPPAAQEESEGQSAEETGGGFGHGGDDEAGEGAAAGASIGEDGEGDGVLIEQLGKGGVSADAATVIAAGIDGGAVPLAIAADGGGHGGEHGGGDGGAIAHRDVAKGGAVVGAEKGANGVGGGAIAGEPGSEAGDAGGGADGVAIDGTEGGGAASGGVVAIVKVNAHETDGGVESVAQIGTHPGAGLPIIGGGPVDDGGRRAVDGLGSGGGV